MRTNKILTWKTLLRRCFAQFRTMFAFFTLKITHRTSDSYVSSTTNIMMMRYIAKRTIRQSYLANTYQVRCNYLRWACILPINYQTALFYCQFCSTFWKGNIRGGSSSNCSNVIIFHHWNCAFQYPHEQEYSCKLSWIWWIMIFFSHWCRRYCVHHFVEYFFSSFLVDVH